MDTSAPGSLSLKTDEVDKQIDKASTTAHGAVDVAAASAEDAADAVRPFISRTAATAHQTLDKVTEAVKPAATWLTEKNEALSVAAQNAEADARSYISAHPWQSVTAALGLGYVIGRLAGRR